MSHPPDNRTEGDTINRARTDLSDYEIGVRLVERHMPQCPGPGCKVVQAALVALGLEPHAREAAVNNADNL